MNIQTIKELNSNYLINESILVPKDSSNKDYRKIQIWIEEGGIIEPEFTNSELLEQVKDEKKSLIKFDRDIKFSNLLFYKKIDGIDLYLKPKPQENIFMAAFIMADGTTKDWYPYDVNGVKQQSSLTITKEELINMATHYEVRKTNVYNLCNQMCFEIDALTTLEQVQNYDINIK
jgi:hypothetical protein